jgi:hypothetical protein
MIKLEGEHRRGGHRRAAAPKPHTRLCQRTKSIGQGG